MPGVNRSSYILNKPAAKSFTFEYVWLFLTPEIKRVNGTVTTEDNKELKTLLDTK